MIKRTALTALVLAGMAGAAQANPINAGFEHGLDNWTVGGDALNAAAVAAFASLAAPYGSSMARISTAPDGVVKTTLSQSFAATTEAITYRVDFITDEAPNSPWNDSFAVITDAGTLLSLDTFSPLSPLAGSGSVHTGWIDVTLPVGTSFVSFEITDRLDTAVESLALIDTGWEPSPTGPANDPAPQPNPAPTTGISEPGALGLFTMGLLGFGLVRRRKAA